VSVSPVRVVKDFKGSRPIYIKYIEGLGSPKATPNLDVESRGPNHTTIVVGHVPSGLGLLNVYYVLIIKVVY